MRSGAPERRSGHNARKLVARAVHAHGLANLGRDAADMRMCRPRNLLVELALEIAPKRCSFRIRSESPLIGSSASCLSTFVAR
jgi:hypothetical protein